MKAIIQSIKPEHVFNMRVGGKRFPLKRIEVRKTAPKETPFKAYIYETKQKEKSFVSKTIDGVQTKVIIRIGGCGKVVGEYICRKVDTVRADNIIQAYYNNRPETRLTDEQLWAYASGKPLKFLFMDDVVFYDTPKELWEFYRSLPEKVLEEGDYDCRKDWDVLCMDAPEGSEYCAVCPYGGRIQITRPPQSWVYVEELEG